MKIRKRVIDLVLCLFLTSAVSSLTAQGKLQLFPEKRSLPEAPGLTFPFEYQVFGERLDSATLQPARIDPDPDYLSFLCRKELEIERALPVGIWLQAGESNPLLLKKPGTGAVTSLRFKLLRF